MIRTLFVSIIALMIAACDSSTTKNYVIDESGYNPRSYLCQRTSGITINGVLDDADWQKVEWSSYFVDIEGDKKPKPQYNTRVKMLWDDDFVYFGAVMEEPHIWATLMKRDAIIYHDNDFEIFIDPNGDTHNYLEYEVNAFGTIWDLMITKPYRDHGLIFDHWDINGIRQAINIDGTINNPADEDKQWSIEVAIPIDVVREACHGQHPEEGTIWRLNFSRVHWHTDIIDGKYVKRKGNDGKNLPEENWVWSPQGVIAMHQPETWGYLQFSESMAGEAFNNFEIPEDEWVKWALRHIYYEQSKKLNTNGIPSSLKKLGMKKISIGTRTFTPEMTTMGKEYQARIKSIDTDGWWNIRRDGYIWKE